MRPSISVVFFDFDGVILESADIKTNAFIELYRSYPEKLDRIVEYHLANQGISRFTKFEWVSRTLFGRELTAEESNELGRKFSDIVFEKVLKAPFVSGALDLLCFLGESNIDAYVASGTPESELRSIVSERGIEKYFRGVFGTPATKEFIVRDIMFKREIPASQILFVGDANTDYVAAKAAGTYFIARDTPEAAEFWKAEGVPAVKDLAAIIDRYEWLRRENRIISNASKYVQQ
jgi:phosphoglycolate phosphatase-like HAD superfamily hydrolase